jgi:hypothetical protein
MLGKMQHHMPILSEQIPNRALRWEKLFCRETFKLLPKGNWLEQHMFIPDLRSLAFKVDELNNFPHIPNNDRYNWKKMVLMVHQTTSTC